jgi:hypothetical protein
VITAPTTSVIGISAPYLRASSRTGAYEVTPSAVWAVSSLA